MSRGSEKFTLKKRRLREGSIVHDPYASDVVKSRASVAMVGAGKHCAVSRRGADPIVPTTAGTISNRRESIFARNRTGSSTLIGETRYSGYRICRIHLLNCWRGFVDSLTFPLDLIPRDPI